MDGFLDRISFLSDFLALISFLLRKVVSFLEELCGWELGRKEGRKVGGLGFLMRHHHHHHHHHHLPVSFQIGENKKKSVS